MEREILFRGKRVDNGEWVYGYLGKWPMRGWKELSSFIIPVDGLDNGIAEQAEVFAETVGQYTGLKDKNGNKIFECDIVLKRTYNGKKPFLVTFDSGMFHCGYGGGSSTAIHGYTLDDRQIEIIGNIFDNPELLDSRR